MFFSISVWLFIYKGQTLYYFPVNSQFKTVQHIEAEYLFLQFPPFVKSGQQDVFQYISDCHTLGVHSLSYWNGHFLGPWSHGWSPPASQRQHVRCGGDTSPQIKPAVPVWDKLIF